MPETIKVSLKDRAKSYEGKDLSLQVFLRGSLVLNIKIGRDWNAPDSYDIPYEGGECRVNIGRLVKNGILESKLISLDDPQFTGDYMDVLMSDSSTEPVEEGELDDLDKVINGEQSGIKANLTWEADGWGLSFPHSKHGSGCFDDSEDCCDDSEGCCGDKDKPF